MEKEVALQLLQRILEKKGADCEQLAGLVALSTAKGFFRDPGQLFSVDEWRKYGDMLWDAIIDERKESKEYKKLLKPWRETINALKRYHCEKKVAAVATKALEEEMPSEGSIGREPGKITIDYRYDAIPNTCASVTVKRPVKSPPPDPPEPAAPSLSDEETAGEEEGEMEFPDPPPMTELERLSMSSGRKVAAKKQLSRIDWDSLATHAAAEGNFEVVAAAAGMQALPVIFTPVPGGQQAAYHALDWKLLMQLRATVNESGVQSEPVQQLLNYIWNAHVLTSENIKGVFRMALTPSQLLLWHAHWQRLCDISAHTARAQGDPLADVTVDQLMGTGVFAHVTMQMEMGPEKCLESMRLAREALSNVRETPATPSYMSLKQGTQEPFAAFVDRLTAALNKANIPPALKAALLRQCALENCNAATRAVLVTLPADAPIELMLERMNKVPMGPQATLMESLEKLGEKLIEGQQQQQEVFAAALAPLKPLGGSRGSNDSKSGTFRCYRCGKIGHKRQQCRESGVWCQNCRQDTHSTTACHRSGNGMPSARGRSARTPIAAPAALKDNFAPAPDPHLNSSQWDNYLQQREAASDWTWQQQ
ncbi:uncharacterized protein ACIBXB_003779 isoform 1-T2 [Morphnus guianensis]